MKLCQIFQKELKQWSCSGLIVLLAVSTTTPWASAKDQTKPTTKQEKSAAIQLYQKAREARAVWHEFPGFSADVTVFDSGQSTQGKMTANKDFKVKLSLDDEQLVGWSLPKLRSVISHRKSRLQKPIPATFADNQIHHPLGRLVNIDGKNVSFRLKDDVITEVHRRSNKSWFTISTLDVWHTKEGSVLPHHTSVIYRDPQTGAITSNRSNTFSFTRVGNFDLPEWMLTVECSENFERNVGSIKLSNHRLLTPESLSQTE
jgi:hypothetical protein